MSRAAQENVLDARAQIFKALGHPARLLILNLLNIKPRHGEELAAILRLNPATISHHLALLQEAGFLKTSKDQYYQVYSLDEASLQKTLAEMIQLPRPGLEGQVKEDAYRDIVLKTFFRQGRLAQIPAQLKKRQIVLERIAQEFEPGQAYSEQQVNQVLVEFHDDVASLRRGLVEMDLMERSQGIYTRKAAE